MYYKTPITRVIDIDKIVTIHYYELASNYVYKGEKHDFWEILYVDKGEVEIMADMNGYKLQQGDVVFHKPNEFHSVWANGFIAPNIVIVSFECNSEAMKFFEGKILKLGTYGRNLMAEIIKEGKDAFLNMMDPMHVKLEKNVQSNFGAEQMVELYLEMLLIGLIREKGEISNNERLSTATKDRIEEDIVNDIIEYMKDNLKENYSFEDICYKFSIGRTMLKTIFKKKIGMGVIAYFRMLKMEEAKRFIREGKYNFTEISNILGYESVHYFSRVFKKYTNMSPTEYSSSVKSRGLI
ncbi:AraC family transcriptional regulator [Desnuesiella massiliensis]|uniref:AraC family transcriptional regulator n=1 Tax=Desnuesiella massiliensis TaxID=1650662 RepID=UPI0006E3028C|nr:AraC family transcriptional regulator [Desnuesiella massiliensis]